MTLVWVSEINTQFDFFGLSQLAKFVLQATAALVLGICVLFHFTPHLDFFMI